MKNYVAVSKKLKIITFQYQITERFFSKGFNLSFSCEASERLMNVYAKQKMVVKKGIWEIGKITKIIGTERVRERIQSR